MAERVGLSDFGYLYRQVVRQAKLGVLWTPLVVQALFALVVALIHFYIFSPITGSLVRGWVDLVGGGYADEFFHYPAHFALFPYFFGNARLLVNIFTEAFLYAILIDMLLALYRGERPVLMSSVRQALRRYLQITVVWFVVIAVLYIINRYFFSLLEDVLGYSLQQAPRRRIIADFSLRGITILIYSVSIFLLPSIMAGGASLAAAVKRGLSMFARHPFVAIGLVLISYLIGFLPSWATSDPNRIVDSFYPELVFYITLISIGLDLIVNYLLVGTSTKFFMDQST